MSPVGEVAPRAATPIDTLFQAWCRRVDPTQCPVSAPSAGGGTTGAPAPNPYLLLSREELLFFFGHRELFCRGDRPLTHFASPEHQLRWAERFTCNMSRGMLESGPFEEGVQVEKLGIDHDQAIAEVFIGNAGMDDAEFGFML